MLEFCRKRFWQFRKISSKTLIIQEKFGRRLEKHIPLPIVYAALL